MPPTPPVDEGGRKARASLLQDAIDEIYGNVNALSPEAQARVVRHYPFHEVQERVRRGLAPMAPTGAPQFPPSPDEPRLRAITEAPEDPLVTTVREVRAQRRGGEQVVESPMGVPLVPGRTPAGLAAGITGIDLLTSLGGRGKGFMGTSNVVGNRQEGRPLRDVKIYGKKQVLAAPAPAPAPAPQKEWPYTIRDEPKSPERVDELAQLTYRLLGEKDVGTHPTKFPWGVPKIPRPPPSVPTFPDVPKSWQPNLDVVRQQRWQEQQERRQWQQERRQQWQQRWWQQWQRRWQEQQWQQQWWQQQEQHKQQEQQERRQWQQEQQQEQQEQQEQQNKEASWYIDPNTATKTLLGNEIVPKQTGFGPEFLPEQFMKKLERTGRFAAIELDEPPPLVQWPKAHISPLPEQQPHGQPPTVEHELPPWAKQYAEELGRDPKELFTTEPPISKSAMNDVAWLAGAFDNPTARKYIKAWKGKGISNELRRALVEIGRYDIIDYTRAHDPETLRPIELDEPAGVGPLSQEIANAHYLNDLRDASELIDEYLPERPEGVKWEEIAALIKDYSKAPEGRAKTRALRELEGDVLRSIEYNVPQSTPAIDEAVNWFKARYPRLGALPEVTEPAPEAILRQMARIPLIGKETVFGITTDANLRGAGFHGTETPGDIERMIRLQERPTVLIADEPHEGSRDYVGYEGDDTLYTQRPMNTELAVETVGHEIGGHVRELDREARGLLSTKTKNEKMPRAKAMPLLTPSVVPLRISGLSETRRTHLGVLESGKLPVGVTPSRGAGYENPLLEEIMGRRASQREGTGYSHSASRAGIADLSVGATIAANELPRGAARALPTALRAPPIHPREVRARKLGKQAAARWSRVKALIPELVTRVERYRPAEPSSEERASYNAAPIQGIADYRANHGASLQEAKAAFRYRGAPPIISVYKKEPKIAAAILRRAAAEAVLKQLQEAGRRQQKDRFQLIELDKGLLPSGEKHEPPGFSSLLFEQLGAETRRAIAEQVQQEYESRKGLHYAKPPPMTEEEIDAIMRDKFGGPRGHTRKK